MLGDAPRRARLEVCAVPHLHVDRRGAHVAWEAAQVDPAKNRCEMQRLTRAVFIPGKGVTPVQPLAEWDQLYVDGVSGCPSGRTPGELQTTLANGHTGVPLCGRGVLSGAEVTTSEVLAMFDAAREALPDLHWSLSAKAPYAPNAPCELK